MSSQHIVISLFGFTPLCLAHVTSSHTHTLRPSNAVATRNFVRVHALARFTENKSSKSLELNYSVNVAAACFFGIS